ncbi:hypothetical protein [Rufibacter ruber]|uniref:hypothetical protein n=1 Tax=Rufibacter ruber TaxID=1783499 RepID=UPI00082ADA20|nr:hypothetical protein [Rufibacter ruber]
MPVQLTIQGLKGIRDVIKAVCEAHLAVAEFKTGLDLNDFQDNLYPLAFLEHNFQINQDSEQSDSYSINLVIADRIPADGDEFLAMSKVTQIFDEIHHQLQELSPQMDVGFANRIPYYDEGDDRLATCNGEFTITIARYTARLNSGMQQPDLSGIPKFGNIL